MSAETEKTYGEDIPESFEYVYLIHPAEYVTKNEPVYKFGKTENISKRFLGYTANCVIYYVCRVKNCHSVEKAIDKDFNKHFTLAERKEYFKGRKSEMIKCIESIINKMDQRVIEDCLVDKITKYYGKRHKIMLDDNTDKTDIIYDYDEVDEENIKKKINKNENAIKKKVVKRNNINVYKKAVNPDNKAVNGIGNRNNNIAANNVFIINKNPPKYNIKEIEKINEILNYERKLVEYERKMNEMINKRERKLLQEQRKIIEKEKFRKHILSDRVYGSE